MLKGNIHLLVNEKQLMHKEMAAQDNTRNMLEDEITRMKVKNKRLTENSAAVQELSDTLNNKAMILLLSWQSSVVNLANKSLAAAQLETNCVRWEKKGCR